MALTYAQLQDEVATVIGTGARSGDVMRTSIGRWINQACRRIAYAYPWDERRAEQRISTVATYATGTATLTQGSTTVTGSGTTWTSAMVGRKIALGVGQPYYRIATRVSDTEITISDAYAETTATASAYVIYQDEYDLAATTHSVENAQVIRDSFVGPFAMYEQRQFEDSIFAGSSTSPPVAGCVCTSTTVGTPRIRITPVPDDIYRISFRYLKTWTDLSADGDLYTASLPVDVEELILDRTLRWAPKIEGSRRVMSDNEFRVALAQAWSNHHKRRYRFGVRRGIGNGYDLPVIMASGLTGIV